MNNNLYNPLGNDEQFTAAVNRLVAGTSLVGDASLITRRADEWCAHFNARQTDFEHIMELDPGTLEALDDQALRERGVQS